MAKSEKPESTSNPTNSRGKPQDYGWFSYQAPWNQHNDDEVIKFIYLLENSIQYGE